MALAPFLTEQLGNEHYRDFYQNELDAGKSLIIDNGAYENVSPMGRSSYYDLLLQYDRPGVIAVLPDYLEHTHRLTVAESLKFLDVFATSFHFIKWMFVPQIAPVQDASTINTAIDTVLNDARVGHLISWIGLGRWMARRNPLFRLQTLYAINNVYPHVQVHALGMNAGSMKEFRELDMLGCSSIDSSAPIWRGLHGFRLGQDGWTDPAFDPYAVIEQNEDIVVANLQEVGIDVRPTSSSDSGE